MVTQTIEIESEYPDEANTTCDARDKVTRAFVQSSAVLTAPDASGVIYLPQFTDLPAGEYLFILKDSSGEKLTYGYATVALQTATYKLSGVPQASQPALATAVASLDTKLGEPALDSIAEDIAAVKTDTAAVLVDTETTIPGLINAINQSASRRMTLATSVVMEIPETGTATHQIEMRTYSPDGDLQNASTNPTLTVNGAISGDLSANLSAVSSPSTGVYRWTLTTAADDDVEQIWLDGSAVMADSTVTARTFSYITDAVAVTFTATHEAQLAAIYGKLPTSAKLTGSSAADGAVDNLATDVISADSVSAAAVTKVQSGLATSTALTTLSNVFTGITKLAGWLRLMSRTDAATATDEATALSEINADGGSGAGTFANITDSLESIVNRGNVAWTGGGGGSSLSGPNTITVTVTNTADDEPIEGALVRFYRTGESGTQETDADGETDFTVGSYTWSVAIAANGFVGQTNTLVVSENASVTYELTAITVTASSVGKCTGYVTTFDQDGDAEQGVPVFITMTATPTGTGQSFDPAVRKVYSDANGLAQFTNMVRGATYDYWRSETGKRFSVTVPDADTVAFPSSLGRYAVQ